MSGRRWGLLPALVGAALLAPTACGSAEADRPTELTVLAAASLTGAFGRIGTDFQRSHPGVKVRFSFGSSASLATQLAQGAPADVFAAASTETMTTAVRAGAVGSTATFASNTLQIAVPPGNRAKVTGLGDFADAAKRIAVCAPQVPCGAAAVKAFAAAGVAARPDSEEADVKAVLQKVEADEVDAGLVYRTDVQAAGDRVQGIDFAEADRAVNTYPIGTVTTSAHEKLAAEFVQYVLSPAGQRLLAEAGFLGP